MNAGFSKPQKIRLCGAIILLGFILSIGFHYFEGAILQRPYPWNTFLFRPDDSMADWLGAFTFVSKFNPFHTLYRGQGNNYPPFGYLISNPFALFGFAWGRIVFAVTFVVAWLWFCAKHVVDSTQTRGHQIWTLLIFGLMPYPFLFALDRLNAECALFLLVLGFYLAWIHNRTRTAAIFIGAAAAAKVYPGFAAILFIRDKKSRQLFIVGSTAVAATALALAVYRTSPLEALDAYRRSAPSFHQAMWDTTVVQHSSSLYSLVRLWQILVLHYNRLPAAINAARVDCSLRFFSIFIMLPIVILALCGWSRRLQMWELLTLAVSAMLLLTPVSFDYKLLYLVFPFAAFLNSDTDLRTGIWFSVFFGLLFIPKDYLVLTNDVTSNVVLNVLILSTMYIWIAIKGLREISFLRS